MYVFSSALIGTYSTEQAVQIEPSPVLGVSGDMQSVLKNGSYAVIIFFFIVFWLTRKNLAEFTKEHLAMMKALTDSKKIHTESSQALVKSVERTTRANIVLAQVLASKLGVDLDSLNKMD